MIEISHPHPLRRLQAAGLASLWMGLGLAGLAALSAPASSRVPDVGDPLGVPAAELSLVFESSGHAAMDAWRSDFAATALRQGVAEETVRAVLSDISPLSLYLGDPGGETATGIADQAEFAKPIWEYIETAVTESRLQRGAQKLGDMRDTFEAIEAAYGVDRQAVAAIWAMETNLGSYIGSFDAANTLANMAVEGRRRAFAERELLALMVLVGRGDVVREQLLSGWAGAMGHTQFMPTTFLAHAVDFDGNGRKDVWDNAIDALASAANYMAASGYQRGQPWGVEVSAPPGFDWALADGQDRRMSTWIGTGLTPMTGAPFDVGEGVFAELWLPAGAQGPKYLLFSNFNVFKTYNRSDSYALAIGLLADGMVGETGPITAWPRELGTLNTQQIMDLQAGLNQLGFPAGPVDGIAGRGTKAALRQFQVAFGLLPDGYPTAAILDYVLAAAG